MKRYFSISTQKSYEDEVPVVAHIQADTFDRKFRLDQTGIKKQLANTRSLQIGDTNLSLF
ncbi:hypothetical protein [Paraglaciecola sp. 2405UD69-4]|uniref:hypothetical protein n=1 Tax=Paraglaciecola sp. 2405UD69-4 TaxID=3391836 RepID=UPI0039C92DD0